MSDSSQLFTKLLGTFLIWVFSEPDRSATLTKVVGTSFDLDFYDKGFFRNDVQAYGPLGVYWKSLHPLCCWGGDSPTVRAGHFYLK